MKKIWKDITEELPPYSINSRIISAFDGAFVHAAVLNCNIKEGTFYFQSVVHPEEIKGVKKWAYQDDLLMLP